MSNLTRYGIEIKLEGGWAKALSVPRPNGEFLKFDDVMEAKILQSGEAPVQQLKAEIAAIVERLQRAYAMRESPDVLDCISELRQLSAV